MNREQCRTTSQEGRRGAPFSGGPPAHPRHSRPRDRDPRRSARHPAFLPKDFTWLYSERCSECIEKCRKWPRRGSPNSSFVGALLPSTAPGLGWINTLSWIMWDVRMASSLAQLKMSRRLLARGPGVLLPDTILPPWRSSRSRHCPPLFAPKLHFRHPFSRATRSIPVSVPRSEVIDAPPRPSPSSRTAHRGPPYEV